VTHAIETHVELIEINVSALLQNQNTAPVDSIQSLQWLASPERVGGRPDAVKVGAELLPFRNHSSIISFIY
jgi:hypothetical protein